MSHSEERSPKRQRRSYSPASPAAHTESKPFSDLSTSQSLPQTPPPSVHMSPSWQSQALSTSAPGSTTFQTPPSTGIHSQNNMERAAESGEGGDSGQQSPETFSRKDSDGDLNMGDSDLDRAGAEDMGAGAGGRYNRTDHERQPPEQVPGAQKLYRLTNQPIAPSRPHPSQNVITLYGLQRIQASIARRDAQGNKINKLRKSYENKVKALGLEGRSKAEVGSNALLGLVDPGWDADIGNGTTTWQARIADLTLNEASIEDTLGKLDSAFSFAPGHFPKAEHENWKSILGLEEMTAKTPAAPSGPNPGAANVAPSKSATSTSAAANAAKSSAPVSPRGVPRPDRVNKKRRYDESSYSGYQDGYDDDGYSTGGADERRPGGAKRQKRKDYPSAVSSPPFNSGNGNGNMVGVRTS